ncbi:MAG: hypothetical protein RR334_00780 [Clostridia bacterium]
MKNKNKKNNEVQLTLSEIEGLSSQDKNELIKMQQMLGKNERKNINKELKLLKKMQKAEEKKASDEKENKRLQIISNWFKLDNAANVYPASGGKDWTFVYRIAVLLNEEVDSVVLQKALEVVMPRFPTFNVTLKRGLFWYYFDQMLTVPKVMEEKEFPCEKFSLWTGEHLFRIIYSGKRISLEAFHALGDGRAAMTFFNSLIREYFVLQGKVVTGMQGCLNPHDLPSPEETEDAFSVYANDKKSNPHKEKKAFKIKGTEEPEGMGGTTYIEVLTDDIKRCAEKHGTKLYLYMVSVFAYVLYQRNKGAKRPIKLSLPIDLRSFFKTETLRNFSSYINIDIDAKKEYTFDDVVAVFKEGFAKINADYLEKNINSNMNIQKAWYVKYLPLFIKSIFIGMGFKLLGEDFYTLAVSNLGVVKAPPEFNKYINRYEVNLGRPKYNAKGVGAIAFNNKLVISINSRIKERFLEKDFCRFLAADGANLRVESDRRDIYGR